MYGVTSMAIYIKAKPLEGDYICELIKHVKVTGGGQHSSNERNHEQIAIITFDFECRLLAGSSQSSDLPWNYGLSVSCRPKAAVR